MGYGVKQRRDIALMRRQQPTNQTSDGAADMKDFNMRFVELCGKEPALYDPRYFKDLESAAGRISGALLQKGFTFGPEEVKPTFDHLRAQYEMELENRIKGRYSELRWFHEMDVYMRPFVRSGPCSPSCSNSDPGVATATVDIKLEEEDDIPCDVCRETLPEDGNEMIFCNLCNVCVHQACYGVRVVPDGDWFCQPCQKKKKPACALCPKEGGAMKCTRDGFQWAHVSCTWWIREARFDVPERVDVINISNIPDRRWKLVCSLCRNKYGACIQCVEPSCTVAYHVTCAFDRGLRMDMCDDPETEDGVKLQSYCRKHNSAMNTPKSKKKRKQKKKTRRCSKDVEKHHTDPLKLPSRYLSTEPQTSTSETVTSDCSINELSEDESTSDSSIHSSAIDSSATQSSISSDSLSADSTFYNTETSGPLITSITGAINGDTNGERTFWNTQTNAMQPPQVSFEGCPKTHQETKTDGKCFCRRTTSNEEPPAKRVRFLEPISEQSSSIQNKSTFDPLPVTATHNTRISFDNNETTIQDSCRTSFSVKISSEMQSKPRESFPTHSQEVERDHRKSFLREQPTPVQTKHCSPIKSQDSCSQTYRDQPSSSSSIPKETIKKSTATVNKHSENVDYEQLTKYVTLVLKKLPPHEAKRLERKIISLCFKNSRTNGNSSKNTKNE